MKNALIVIDVQESFRRRPLWEAVSNPDIVDQVNRLVAAARERGELVVWVLHNEPGTGDVFDAASGFVRLMDGLEPREGEPVIVKTSLNSFTTTNLHQTLTRNGVGKLTVCGIRTEQCCETTTRVAFDLGYEVDFVVDATATFPIPRRDAPADRSVAEIVADPSTMQAADVVERTVFVLDGRFATIRTVDEVTGVPVGAVG
ncbi:cysteine hydrolase family protein [Thermopolyspora sp. NPDC052614]|uniref:cysteine hydrolase family protein n=1 Tax=Thermopolyspora sp. NPDC052614 TaxID=3155682 RepID=UPI003426A88A